MMQARDLTLTATITIAELARQHCSACRSPMPERGEGPAVYLGNGRWIHHYYDAEGRLDHTGECGASPFYNQAPEMLTVRELEENRESMMLAYELYRRSRSADPTCRSCGGPTDMADENGVGFICHGCNGGHP